MRVIAGKARRLPLKAVPGLDTRPTVDRIKETLFNIIQSDIPGCIFVDVFSGSGGIGIEALSRGASKAYFIDNDKEAINCIESNLKFTKLINDSKVLKGDVLSALNMIDAGEVDIIFMDPPYDEGLEESVFAYLNKLKFVTDNTLIILESRINNSFSFPGFDIIREKKYKTNKHIFLRRSNE